MISIFSLENYSSGLIYLRRIRNKQEILSWDKNFSKNVWIQCNYNSLYI